MEMAAVSATIVGPVLGPVASRQTSATQVRISIGGHSERSFRNSGNRRTTGSCGAVRAHTGASESFENGEKKLGSGFCSHFGVEGRKFQLGGRNGIKVEKRAGVSVNRQSLRKRRANRRDDSESSSDEETNDTDKETLEEQNDSKINGDEQGADSQESGGEIGEVSREEEAEGDSSREDEADRNETSLQNEGSKPGFWRKIWELGQKNEDNTLGAKEELLLQDLESLRFDWRGLLDPTWENLVALGFTALLTLALFKIFSQLILVVITIVLSALKYTVLAALLLGLLIFLL